MPGVWTMLFAVLAALLCTVNAQSNSTALVNGADTAFVMLCTALVLVMTPGLALFYGGMARSHHALSTMFSGFLSLAIVTIQWYIWGYSLAYSSTGGSFIGDFQNAIMRNVGVIPHSMAPTIPAIVFSFYQMMFAVITPAIAFGGIAERSQMHVFAVFIFVWTTLVYDFVAYWTWSSAGWLRNLGSLGTTLGRGAVDFAGGGPVHISSGCAALAYCIIVGKRNGFGRDKFHPHNITQVVLGTGLLWFGWFGFNGGSALAADALAVSAMQATNMAAATGGIVWMIWDVIAKQKMSAMGFCSGAVTGLVAITPGAGYVSVSSAIVFGVVAGTACYFACYLKIKLGYDDAFDVFAVHGVGGVVGYLLTGIFASLSVASFSNSPDAAFGGGWLDGHFMQVGYQLVGILAIIGWSFTVSLLILLVLKYIPGWHPRASKDDENLGIDVSLMGENAYDYVPFIRGHSSTGRGFAPAPPPPPPENDIFASRRAISAFGADNRSCESPISMPAAELPEPGTMVELNEIVTLPPTTEGDDGATAAPPDEKKEV
eukprot:TRINITY_DN10318_c0_g2_i1.p1 TRINITY_DN10318_c0_g2~~TRINITY_DN10318_c0_g2_i1.p1  ORF type:complete len:543 (-),score=96.74 TRINITY_DN10318_c0_g2_i1:106-1734(-)